MARRPPLRSPFLVTIALASPLLAGATGCSGKVQPTPVIHGNPPASFPDGGDTGDAGCPATQPTGGGPCAVAASAQCSYDTPGECCPGPTYTCMNGTWDVEETSCNPPACAPVTLGQACSASSACGESACPMGSGACIPACTGGVWTLPSTCPKDAGAGDATTGDAEAGTSDSGGGEACSSCAGGCSGTTGCGGCTGGELCCPWAGGACLPDDAGGCAPSSGVSCATPTPNGLCPNQCYP
jgi:hypothetical protein